MNYAGAQDLAVGYEETAASIFSLCEVSWREVRLRTGPSFPAKKFPGTFGESNGNSTKAGGFGYEESSHNASPCRNRVILWYDEDTCWCALYRVKPTWLLDAGDGQLN